MLGFFKRKSTKDLLNAMAVEMKEGHHYIIVVPDNIDPDELLDSGFFDDYNVFIVQAKKLTILEIG